MQALARSQRGTQAALEQVGRLISTSSAALHEGRDGGQGGRYRGKEPRDAYAPWAREVYGYDKGFGRSPRDDMQQLHWQGGGEQQQRRGEWRPRQGRQEDGERRSWRERHNGGEQLSSWRPRRRALEVEGEGLRINYADAEMAMEDPIYVRVAPRLEQRQSRMYPAYIYNVSQSLLRSDIAAFFDGYQLPTDEIRPEYSWKYFAVERFWLNFGSAMDRERAMSRHMAYLGTRCVLMQRATPQDFTRGIYNPLAMSSRGRYVLVENIASSSTSEDLIRFFQGYDLHAKSVTFLRDQQHDGSSTPRQRGSGRGTGHSEKAVVRFTSLMEAHRALRDRQAGFCGNNQVRLRVLH